VIGFIKLFKSMNFIIIMFRTISTECVKIGKKNCKEIGTLRYTYGPSMSFKDGRVVSNFIFQALHSQDITIYGNGKQTRSFCYVSDLVDGLIKLMDSESDMTGPVNLGNPQEIEVNELAEKIIQLTDSKSKIVHEQLPSDDPKQRKPDITYAKTKLSWTPKVSLEDGLLNTIYDFQHRLDS
jgi:UDP-glucuronate decarboxylase